ncbi:hypothetical protein ACIQLJ_11995 [Microbacterium sp. NPDC091313]
MKAISSTTSGRRLPLLATAVIATAITLGSLVAGPAASASAATASCSGGTCTVYLTKAETAALGNGRVPAAPSYVAGPLRAAYYALAYGHVFFAKQYAGKGWCSGFRLSIVPWSTQGYFGYRC